MPTGWKCVHTASIESNTDTQAKIKVTCYWQNDGYTHNVNYVSAWVYCNGSSYEVKSGGSSGNVTAITNTTQKVSLGSHTFTIDKTTSSQKIACYAEITSKSTYHPGTSTSADTTVAVSAKTSYTVKYEANGGSGAPSNQKKWYGTTLKLSSTEPTRTGYSFQGWGTSASDTSVNYTAGGSYNANSAATLYAIWKANTYSVKYNANGGFGEPSEQKKTYGKTLTLSSTKPTKTGYSFRGWATSSGGSVAYKAGGSYTSNSAVTLYAVWSEYYLTVNYYSNYADYGTLSGSALSVGASTNVKVATGTFYYDNSYSSGLANVQNKDYLYLSRTGYSATGSWGTSTNGGTLINQKTSYSTGQNLAKAFGKDISADNASVNVYAQWKANTYTVTYNPNGGFGAPSDQTKTYGVNLTLSNTKPTRTNYAFKGWATSQSGSVVYASGASYTTNANVTLYAVWELSYVKPRIKNLTVSRCDDSNNPTDQGTYALVEFNWETDRTVSSIKIEWKPTNSATYASTDKIDVNVSDTGDTGGSVTQRVGGSLSTEKSYTLRITVTDTDGNTNDTRNISGSIYHIDCKPPTGTNGVGGVAIGKPAELDGTFDIGFKSLFTGGIDAVLIPAGKDLNTLLTPNIYRSAAAAGDGTTGNYINCPIITKQSFVIEVLPTGNNAIMQRLSICSKEYGGTFERHYYQNEWGHWYRTYSRRGTLLWNSVLYMSSIHTAELSENISAQPTGIVLSFCEFADGTVVDDHFHEVFIPKYMVLTKSGKPHNVILQGDNFDVVGAKKLYIYDDRIVGDDANVATGTAASGIKYTNNAFVLRYVIGV